MCAVCQIRPQSIRRTQITPYRAYEESGNGATDIRILHSDPTYNRQATI